MGKNQPESKESPTSYGPARSCEDDVVTGSDSSENGDRGDEGKGIVVEGRVAPPKEEEED